MNLPGEKKALNFGCKLTVPADLRFVTMAQSWGRELAALANLQPRDGLPLELAVEEGFSNAAQHAYPDGCPGPVHLEAFLDGLELTVSIRDEGVPYHPDAVPAQPEEAGSFARVGLTLIRHAVDELCFINHGRGGKELRLTRYLLGDLKAPPQKAIPELALAPQQSYQIRRMLPEEALQVARVFWLSYGYSYSNERFYQPEGLQHLIDCGKLISFVAVAENGEVVGHAGLLRPEPLPVAEAGLLVVSPAHRGRGLMEKLTGLLVATGVELQLYGIKTNAATSHAVTQRETVRSGGVPCGLDLGAAPPVHFKAMVEGAMTPQRESYLGCFLNLVPSPPPASACVPARHREMVSQVYEALGRPLTFVEEGPATGPASFRVTFDRVRQKGLIRVVTSDPQSWAEILRSANDLMEIGGAEVVDLDLPLVQPATAAVWELAEAAGFFFAGIRPYEAPDGDLVRLKRLAIALDVERLVIYPKFARKLRAYVAAEQKLAQPSGLGTSIL